MCLPLDWAVCGGTEVNNSIFGRYVKASFIHAADVRSGQLPLVCIWGVIYWLSADLGVGSDERRGTEDLPSHWLILSDGPRRKTFWVWTLKWIFYIEIFVILLTVGSFWIGSFPLNWEKEAWPFLLFQFQLLLLKKKKKKAFEEK